MTGPNKNHLASRAIQKRFIEDTYARILVAFFPLILLYLLASEFPNSLELTYLANRVGPIWFTAILSIGAVHLLRCDVYLIWTPIFWFPAQSAIFFGLGPLVLVFGNDVTRQQLSTHFLSVTNDELIWANQLSAIGVLCLLIGIFLHLKLSRRMWHNALSEAKTVRQHLSPRQVAIVFVVFGALLKYCVVLPAAWGVINMTVPGFLTSIVALLDIGFAIMAFLAARGNSRMRAMLIVLLPIHATLSLLTFSKTEIIISLLFPALGDLMGRQSLRRFFILVLGIALVFVWSQDFIQYGRGQIEANTGAIWQAGYGERAAIAERYIVGGETQRAVVDQAFQSDFQGWWTRLNYAGVQVAARNLYMSGVPNDSFHDAWLYLIPRLLWPEKPLIVGPGWSFYERLTGNEATFLGLSIYGDLFWLGGWSATMGGTFLIGWMFAMMSVRSIQFLRDQNFLMFPLVLLSLKTAIFAPTNFVSNGILAVIPLYLAYVLLLHVVRGLLAFLPTRRLGRRL